MLEGSQLILEAQDLMVTETCLKPVALQGVGPLVPLRSDELGDHWLATTLAECSSSGFLHFKVTYFMELRSCVTRKFRSCCAYSMNLWIYHSSSGSTHAVVGHLTKAQSLGLYLKRARAILLTDCVAAWVLLELFQGAFSSCSNLCLLKVAQSSLRMLN